MKTIIQKLQKFLCFASKSHPLRGGWKGFLIPLLGGLGGLVSCSESVTPDLPAGGNIAYANFVHAAEAFWYGGSNDGLLQNNLLFINDSVDNTPFNNYNGKWQSYPATFTTEAGVVRQYPLTTTGINVVTESVSASVYWLPMHAIAYRFIFTSKDRYYLHAADEGQTLENGTYNIFYLVESLETDSSYVVIRAPVERKPKKEGTVTVQVVHLSPDLGEVEVYRVYPAGSESGQEADFPKTLVFGENTSAELELLESGGRKSKVLLRFRNSATGDDLNLSATIPAESGAIYTLLIQGFTKETLRKVKTGNGLINVKVQPNLRCTLRRVFY